MHRGVNLAAHLQFKTSPKLVEQATKATNKHIKCATQFSLREEKQAYMIRQKLKLYASKLLQFLRVLAGHLTML
jgi:hypothetical protein